MVLISLSSTAAVSAQQKSGEGRRMRKETEESIP